MKTIFVAIALSLFSVIALAGLCMDAMVSPLGYYDTATSDETLLDERDC